MSALSNVKVVSPTYQVEIPSTKEKKSFRPFRVGDEKVLLMAAESKDRGQMTRSLKQVVGNCVEGVDVDKLASFDLEYLFLQLRSVSVGETSKISLPCKNCETRNDVEVDISKVKVIEEEKHTKTILLGDNLVLEMRYPDIDDISKTEDGIEGILDLICKSVKTVFYGEETITITPAEHADLKGIIEQLTTNQFQNVQDFFATMPKLREDIDFKCSECGHENSTPLEGMASFF